MNKIRLVSIILPTYNEAENIIDMIREIDRRVTYQKQIIVVDDNSPDGTSRLVADHIQQNKRDDIVLKTRYKNRGLTNSIKKGIKLSKGDIIVWLDCDFSMPPAVINQLLTKISEGYDIVVGSRFIPGGKIKETDKIKKDSPVVIFLSRIMNYSIQLLLGRHFKDYSSGFVASRKNVFQKITLRGDYGEYFIDFIYKAFAYQYKILEIPYICVSRKKGVSKTGTNLLQYLMRGQKYMVLTGRLLIEKHIFHIIP